MGYYDDKLPPAWHTRLERLITFNWQLIFIVSLMLGYLYFAFVHEERTDDYPSESYERTSR